MERAIVRDLKVKAGDVLLRLDDRFAKQRWHEAKADYEERMRSINEGREGRGKFGSKKGKKNKEVPSSSTNRQKARHKNFQMVSHSFGVRSKKNASLREKSKRLRKHVTQAKKRMK